MRTSLTTSCVSRIPLLVYFALITMQLILLTQLTYGCSFSLGHMVPLESQIVVEKNPSTSADAKEVIAVESCLFLVFLFFAKHEVWLTVMFLVCQLVLTKDQNTSTTVVQGGSSLTSPTGVQEEASFMGKGGEQQFGYQPNVYAPQPHTPFSGG